MMFTEHPFLDRFAAASEAGFTAVEFLFPYEHTPEAVGDALRRNGLTQALFNLPPGDFALGRTRPRGTPGRSTSWTPAWTPHCATPRRRAEDAPPHGRATPRARTPQRSRPIGQAP